MKFALIPPLLLCCGSLASAGLFPSEKVKKGLFKFPVKDRVQFIAAHNRSEPIRLAVSPSCGSLNSTNFTEINTGIQLNATRTVVAFGDSWTSNGSNGTIPFAPVVFPPNPSAGARFGNFGRSRASNGYVWPESLGNTIGAKVIDYAVGGAVVDLQAWNNTRNKTTFTSDNLLRVDLVEETALFFQQGHFLSDLNPDETLYVFHFGINDRGQFQAGGGNWTEATNTYIAKIQEIIASGAKNILVAWLYFSDPNTDAMQDAVHQSLQQAHAANGTNFATVNWVNLFTAINASMSSFGYNNVTCLASQNTTEFGCTNPDKSVFYIPGHPSAVTHQLMTEYIIKTVEECTV